VLSAGEVADSVGLLRIDGNVGFEYRSAATAAGSVSGAALGVAAGEVMVGVEPYRSAGSLASACEPVAGGAVVALLLAVLNPYRSVPAESVLLALADASDAAGL
jgi:hypothetical protein